MGNKTKTMDKKGFFSHVQFAILAVVAIIVFILFLAKTYDKVTDKMATQDCKNSIAAHSLVAKGSFSEIFTDIKCPTREVTIKKLSKTNEMIAEDMHRCWYIWGQGQGQYFQGEGTFCHVCSVYQFGDKGRTVTGLNRYLMNTDVPVRYPGETAGIKYVDYFQGYASPNADRKVDNSIQVPVELDNINTSERYATIFIYASGKDSIDKMLEGGKRTTAITGLAMFGMIGGFGSASAASTASVATTTSYFLAYTAGGSQFMWPIAASTATAAGGAGATVGGMTVATTTVTGTVLGLTPVGWVVIGTVSVGAAIWGVYALLDTPDPEWMAYVAFRPYNPDEFEALGCDKMVVNQMSNVGR